MDFIPVLFRPCLIGRQAFSALNLCSFSRWAKPIGQFYRACLRQVNLQRLTARKCFSASKTNTK